MTLKPGTFLQNRYEILKIKGVGGMSVVYKARCHKLNRFVAIKVLKEEFAKDEEFVAKFKMEAQAAASLIHPNIVNMYDVVDEGNLHFIVMEYIEGVTLKTYIASRKQLSPNAAVSITMQIAQAINVAHQKHIIHRDIKPQNILITQEGKIKVADFGIARAVSKQTIGKSAIGSVHYLSPEQAKGEASDERSDIYSLGITMYEMLTGRVPFEGENAVNIAMAQIEKPITLPSVYNKDIGLDIENIVLKCVQKRKAMRYQNTTDLIKDLIATLPSQQKQTGSLRKAVDDGTRQFSSEEIGVINARVKSSHISTDVEELYEEENENEVSYDNYDEEVEERERKIAQKPRLVKKEDLYEEYDENEKNKFMERLFAIVGVIVALIIISVLAFLFFRLGDVLGISSRKNTSSESTLATNMVKVPNIIELSENLAEQKLKEFNLQIRIDEEVYSDEFEKGQVISQDPLPDETVSKYTRVDVIISKGSDRTDLKGFGLENMKADDAKSALESAGFSVYVVEEANETIPAGFLIRYSPEEPERGSLVTLYKSTGKAVVKSVVPDVKNQSEEYAKRVLEENGFVVGLVLRQFDETIAKDLIISQSVEAGTEMEKGTAIGFVVSDGPDLSKATSESQNESTQATIGPEATPTIVHTQMKVRYTASLNETYDLKDQIGPGASNVNYSVLVRLKQVVNGNTVYTTLMEPRKIPGDTILPVRFSIIEGAEGVESGVVEIVKIDNDNSQHILQSYDVLFFPGR